ncbi:MAG: glycosyltransferase family 2 protein [Planctomycetota bacterium]
MRRTITAIVPAFNEARNIRDCLASLDWVDELLVVDSGSTDGTLEIARELADTVLQHEYKYSAAQKNWTIPQAKYAWVLLLDADERCTADLKAEIIAILNAQQDPPHGAYWIYRRNHFLGREIKYCHWDHDRVIRLFQRDNYRYENFKVHAEIQPQVNVGRLNNRLLHHPYRDLDDYFKKLIRYTPWGAEKALRNGLRGGVIHIIFRPAWEFFRRYFLYLGFMDGVHGLVISLTSAIMIAFRYIKLWEICTKDYCRDTYLANLPGGEREDPGRGGA